MKAWRDSFGRPSDDLGALMWLAASADETGSTRTSYRAMATAWGWSLARVQRFVARAEKAGAIKAKSIRDMTTISVDLQIDGNEADTLGDTHKSTPHDDLFAGVEAAPVAKKKATKASRLDPSWRLTKRLGEWAVARGHSAEWVRSEAERFRLYWINATGQKALKRDWDATWSQWVLNAERRQSLTPAGGDDAALAAYMEKYRERR